MKNKILIIALLSVLSSCYAEATHLYHFEEHNVKLPESIKQRALASKELPINDAKLEATADAITAKVNTNVAATGSSSFSITNQDEFEMKLTVSRYMCINGDSCTHTQDGYSLIPGDHMTNNASMFTVRYMEQSGTFSDESYITVPEIEGFASATNKVIIV